MREKLSAEHQQIMQDFFAGCTSSGQFTKVAHFFADTLALNAASLQANLEDYPDADTLAVLSPAARGYVQTRLEDELGAAALVIALCGFLVSDSTGGKLSPPELAKRMQRVSYQMQVLTEYMLENGQMMAVDKTVPN